MMKKLDLIDTEFLIFLMVCFMLSVILNFFPIQKIYVDTLTILESQSTYTSNSYESTRYLLSPILNVLEYMGFTSKEYSSLGGASFYLLNILAFFVYAYLYGKSWYKYKFHSYYLGQRSRVYFIILLFLPFTAVMNKETLSVILGMLVCGFLDRFSPKYISSFFIVGLYSLGGRYYFLAAYIIFILMNIYLKGIKSAILISLLFIAAGYFVYSNPLLYGILNSARPNLSESIDSYIALPFDEGSYVSFLLNRMYLLFFSFFPVVKFGKLYYLIYTLFFSYLSVVLVLFRVRSTDERLKLCCDFILSFYFIQAIFEPDLGSLIRHRIYLLPFYFLLFSRLGRVWKIKK